MKNARRDRQRARKRVQLVDVMAGPGASVTDDAPQVQEHSDQDGRGFHGVEGNAPASDRTVATVQLPELCRAELLKLFMASKRAELEALRLKQLYESSANAVIAALGLDPRDDNMLDLDLGVIALATKKDGSP